MEIIEKNKCTGCTACYNICPKGAIEMKEINGFKYPYIDNNKCINCGLCKKICPIHKKNNDSLNKCYVGYSNDIKDLEKSSSGGIFPLIARNILNDNGIVIGASFKNNKLSHIIIDNIKDLDKLKGSKYLQSDLSSIFKYIKENINNKKILFVGTPCQVGGLKSYLKKDYENLICIDLICHGVPSPKLFDKYVKYLEDNNNDKLKNYNFRDKKTGWDTYSNTATFKNKKYTELASSNSYMKLFLKDIALRESCYDCNFKLGNKYSDITLGDFWNVQKYYPDMYNKKGVSAIIINTEKGNHLFNIIKDSITYKECNIDEILKGNPSLKYSSIKPINRDNFFKDLNTLSFNEINNKYTKTPLYIKVLRKLKKISKKIFK